MALTDDFRNRLRPELDGYARLALDNIDREFPSYLTVLLTGPGRHHGQLAGRTPWLQPVHLPAGAALIGTEQMVRIVAASTNSLSATLAEEPAAA